MRRLVRFRADPRRVRVAVRRDGDEWVATVSPRLGVPVLTAAHLRRSWSARSRSPLKALAKALRAADDAQLGGMDLSMGWAYEHPHWSPG